MAADLPPYWRRYALYEAGYSQVSETLMRLKSLVRGALLEA
jgi:hypothetical protein